MFVKGRCRCLLQYKNDKGFLFFFRSSLLILPGNLRCTKQKKMNIYKQFVFRGFFLSTVNRIITAGSDASQNKSFRRSTTTACSRRVLNSTLFSDPSSPDDETFALRVTITFELSFPRRGWCILRYNTVA
jgi:hypothetical protein